MVLQRTARLLLHPDHRRSSGNASYGDPVTERERDERDLEILFRYPQDSKSKLMREFGVSRYYLDKLLREAHDES